jgi:hypothetical protein
MDSSALLCAFSLTLIFTNVLSRGLNTSITIEWPGTICFTSIFIFSCLPNRLTAFSKYSFPSLMSLLPSVGSRETICSKILGILRKSEIRLNRVFLSVFILNLNSCITLNSMPQANNFTSLKDKDISRLLIPFIAAIFIFCTYLLSGIYYGWVDDVLMEQTFRGMFTAVPIADTFLYFRGIGHIFVALYKYFPAVPWYGIVFLLTAWLTCTFIFSILYKAAIRLGLSFPIQILIYLIAYCAFMYDAVMLLNFTKLSLFLCSTSILYFSILYIESEIILSLKSSIILLIFNISFLIRPETNILSVIPSCGLLVCHALYFSPDNKVKTGLLASILLILPLLTLWADNNVWASADKKEFQKKWKDIHSLLDENNINKQIATEALKNPKDSIRLVALSSWYYYDETKIDAAYLKKINDTQYTNKSLAYKAITQYFNAAKRYTANYSPQLNWFNKGAFFLIMCVLLTALIVRTSEKNRTITTLSLLIGPVALILFVAILYKMEERVYTPYIVAILLSLITFYSFLKPPSNKSLITCLCILAIMGVVNVYQNHKLSAFKKDELEKKRGIIAELNNTYSNKILVFDYFSRLLIHDTPFTNAYLNNSNTYLIWGENSLQQFASHRKYLTSILGKNNFSSFIDYTLSHTENTVFVICNYRRDLIQSYTRILYNKPIKFTRQFTTQNNADKLHYSFVWDSISYNYYKISLDSIPIP